MEQQEVEVGGETPAIIPEGRYDAVLGKTTRLRTFGVSKLALEVVVLIPNEHHPNGLEQVRLLRYYNVRLGPGGRLIAGAHSLYRRDWLLVANRRPARRDRLSPTVFENVLVEVDVRTVRMDYKQRPLPEFAKYSIIDRIVTLKAGSGAVR